MSFHPFFLLTLLLFVSLSEQKINKNQVVLAINCGGDEYSDVNGIVYSEDKYYDRGTTSDHGLNYDISGTDDMDLYQTERWSPDTLTYSLPVKEEGKYVLILKFSEVYFQSAGDKIFDVALGKKTVLKNLDIFAKVGKAAALDEFIEFEIKNRKVYVDRTEAKNAYDADKKVLRVKFIKGPKDNPKIAVAAYVENAGFGASWALPVASLMLEKYLNGEICEERKPMEDRMLETKFF